MEFTEKDIIYNSKGVREFKMKIQDEYILKEGDVIYVSKSGDTFDGLAQKYYGDSTKFRMLIEVNNLQKLASLNIPTDTQLIIPAI